MRDEKVFMFSSSPFEFALGYAMFMRFYIILQAYPERQRALGGSLASPESKVAAALRDLDLGSRRASLLRRRVRAFIVSSPVDFAETSWT
jgi:hypothetical protein